MGLVDVAGIGGFVEMGWSCCVLGCILMTLRLIFTQWGLNDGKCLWVAKMSALGGPRRRFWVKVGSLLGLIFDKSRCFRYIFQALTWGLYLVPLLEGHGCQNVCFLRWLTFTEHSK